MLFTIIKNTTTEFRFLLFGCLGSMVVAASEKYFFAIYLVIIIKDNIFLFQKL